MKNELFKKLNKIRGNDNYGSDQLRDELQNSLFPSSTGELTLELSGVTSAFYGLMLKNIGDRFGFDKIDDISKGTFYELGIAKSKQCSEKMTSIPRDTRAFLVVLASAIYNASPEYTFNVITYTKSKTVFELNGVDRYLRILNQLNIAHYVTFPTLLPFMNGIKDFFGINCEIRFNIDIHRESNKIRHSYEFFELPNQ